IWAEWQSQDPQRFQNVDGNDSRHAALNADSAMPFYGDEIGSALVTNGPGYCYTYDDLPAPPSVPRNKPKVMMSMKASNFTDASPEPAPQPQAQQDDAPAPEDDSQPQASDEDEQAAEGFFVKGHSTGGFFANGQGLDSKDHAPDAKFVDFAPPQPMDRSWLQQSHYDPAEAARMQALVSNVVDEINAERRLAF
ncbi:hypothetical protein GGF43_003153, partial [Coemansia sp. RSA 2618]